MHSTLFLFIFVKFLLVLALTDACIDLLNNNWSRMSVEERAERAEIVLIIKVMKKFNPVSKNLKFHAAKCKILDVLKGWQSFNKNSTEVNGWINERSIIINGFGQTLDCLSQVEENEIYIFFGMFKVDANLWATYFTSFGAAETFNPDIYERILVALGLHNWSNWTSCSKKCGAGIQERSRNCILMANCDYSWIWQSKVCNWQSCENIILSNNDFVNKDLVDLRSILASSVRKLSISISFRNLSQENHKVTEFFFLKLIDSSGTILRLSINSNAIVQIESDKFKKQIKLLTGKLYVKNDEILMNVFMNDSGLYFESFCQVQVFNVYQELLEKFFSSQIRNINSKLSPIVTMKISTDSMERYKSLFCEDHLYNHSHKLLQPSDAKVYQISTPSPKYEWSKCSVTCGIGWQRRYSLCSDEECHDAERDNMKSEIRTCFAKEKCPDESCKVTCENDAQCIQGKCFCVNGFQGQFCEIPICNEKCSNGAKCVGPNTCSCPEGFEGKLCETIKCDKKCLNGGQCLTPNKCTCAFGFAGKSCGKRKCSPPCQNGGACQPGNICSCPEGLTGISCEKYECYPQCMNGGACIGKNKCKCPSDFSGSFCENHICNGCFNGGKCIDNICQCPVGYYGTKCQSKVCITGLKFRKIIKPVILQFPIIVSNKMCIDSTCTLIQPQRSVIVNKVIFKPYIDCI